MTFKRLPNNAVQSLLLRKSLWAVDPRPHPVLSICDNMVQMPVSICRHAIHVFSLVLVVRPTSQFVTPCDPKDLSFRSAALERGVRLVEGVADTARFFPLVHYTSALLSRLCNGRHHGEQAAMATPVL